MLYAKSTKKKVIIIEAPLPSHGTPQTTLSGSLSQGLARLCFTQRKSNDLEKMKHFGFNLFCTVYLIINSSYLINICAIQMEERLMALTEGRNSKEISK